MGFHDIRSRSAIAAPQRAPASIKRAIGGLPDAAQIPENHDFPDRYEPHGALILGPRPTPLLDASLVRLIEMAAASMGCSHEEVLAMKAEATLDPAPMARFCQEIYDTRERAARENGNPLFNARGPSTVAFWVEGFAGKAIATAALTPSSKPLDGQTIELYDPVRTPFPNYSTTSWTAIKAALVASRQSLAKAAYLKANPVPQPAKTLKADKVKRSLSTDAPPPSKTSSPKPSANETSMEFGLDIPIETLLESQASSADFHEFSIQSHWQDPGVDIALDKLLDSQEKDQPMISGDAEAFLELTHEMELTHQIDAESSEHSVATLDFLSLAQNTQKPHDSTLDSEDLWGISDPVITPDHPGA